MNCVRIAADQGPWAKGRGAWAEDLGARAKDLGARERVAWGPRGVVRGTGPEIRQPVLKAGDRVRRGETSHRVPERTREAGAEALGGREGGSGGIDRKG